MKTNNRTTKTIGTMGAGLLAVAMGAVILLAGCSSGGASSGTGSAVSWPPATPPATSQTNTYVGTQAPGLYSVTIDHTNNSFSYQNLSTSSSAVSGVFTATSEGFLNLGAAGWALEELSRAVILIPPNTTLPNDLGSPVFAVAAPSCQIVPSRAAFAYVAPVTLNYQAVFHIPLYPNASIESDIGNGSFGVSSDATGANWSFGGELQTYVPATSQVTPITYTPTPDPFTGTCGTKNGVATIQTADTVPDSVPATIAVGPTGFLMEDRYQSDEAAFIGAVEPPSPVDVTTLKGAAFLGVQITNSFGNFRFSQLVSCTASADSSGSSEKLVGGAYPSNDPTQPPATTGITIDLGTQDPNNNGSFPTATLTLSGSSYPATALVTNAGGKVSIFVLAGTGTQSEAGFLLFQQ